MKFFLRNFKAEKNAPRYASSLSFGVTFLSVNKLLTRETTFWLKNYPTCDAREGLLRFFQE